MDVWLKPTNENRDRLIPTLTSLGIVDDDIERMKIDFGQMVAFHFGDPPERVDFVTRISGIQYEQASEKKVFLSFDGHKIPVLHFDDLIISKITSNRAKDKADVEELQKIMQLKKKT